MMMLKGTVENKQHVDIFEAMDGRRFTRADVEDPSRPGYLRPELVPIEPGVWSAGAHFGLLTPSGRPLRYVEVKADPREPHSDEAPAELREQVKKAEAAAEDVRRRVQAVLDERVDAKIEYTRAAARGDAKGYDKALARENAAMERYRDLMPEEVLASKRLADAQAAVWRWVWDERIRRTEAQRKK